MSKHINLNPGLYKVGRRERPGQDIVAEEHLGKEGPRTRCWSSAVEIRAH
jgi:hypothetical protein